MRRNNKSFKRMNIIMIICIIIFGEVFSYLNDLYLGAKLHQGKLFFPYSMKVEKFSNVYKKVCDKGFGKKYGQEYKNKPIILFGGSYVYGYGLKDEDTLSFQLADYIKKPVVNRAYQTWCIQNMLWQLKNTNIYKEIEEPETLIYMGVKADLENIYNPDILNGLKYEDSVEGLKEVPFPFMLLNYSYLYKKFNHEISFRKTLNREETIKFFNKHVIEAKKEADKHWKNYKMIILWYDLPVTEEFSELEKLGIKVISLNDFMQENIFNNDNFKNSKADIHPNGKAWKIIIPELVKKTGL